MANVGAGANEFCNNATHMCSARDSEGHGTHTTTTAAGDCVASAPLYGVERGPVCGIAPGARVIQYRVCLRQGCFSSDSVAAVQQAILDGVDVINFSISGGAQPVHAMPSSSRSSTRSTPGSPSTPRPATAGPGAATSDHGGPWVTTVGASTGAARLRLDAAPHRRRRRDVRHARRHRSRTASRSATPVVLAATLRIPGEDALCQSKLARAARPTGKIVACQRGDNGRIDKGRSVLAGGAAGMILYNPVKQDVETDNHFLPAIHVDGPTRRRCSPSSTATRT